jgi:enamine deaminase RidA (YjgF/YER057c/UK114 family)
MEGNLADETGMPMKQHSVQPDGLAPVNGYSQAVAYQGRTIVVSGQVPLDADGNLVGAGDPERQADQVFANLIIALAAAGAGIQDLVKLTVYLTNRADVAAFRRVRDRHIDLSQPPASSLVVVSGLVDPEFRIEIDAVAVR